MKNLRRRCKGDTWWLNEDMKEVGPEKKDVQKVMCRNSTEAYKNRCKSIKKIVSNVVLIAA